MIPFDPTNRPGPPENGITGTSQLDLGRELRKLLEFSVIDEASLDAFHKETVRFEDLMNKARDVEVPHFLWHWLSDADIRLKDPDYARWQNQLILQLIEAWESGAAPPASVSRAHGFTIPLGPPGVPPAAWGKFVASVGLAVASSTFDGLSFRVAFALAGTAMAAWGLRSKPRWFAVLALIICVLASLDVSRH